MTKQSENITAEKTDSVTSAMPIQEKTTSKDIKPSISINLPYLNAYGNITKVLDKLINASTPERFSQDFLASKLGFKGGSSRPIVPFLKRTGFLNSDGTPTDLYKEFRNVSFRGKAAAKAVKKGYSDLYEIDEYVHELGDKEIMGVIVQATGLDANSKIIKTILGSFKALKSFANFEEELDLNGEAESNDTTTIKGNVHMPQESAKQPIGLKLGYVINLNLPATSDIAVYNAIFKSLREHILEQ